MNNRLLLVVLIAGINLVVNAAPTSAAQTKPNVVMIISDDQGWMDFGFMGHLVIKTPHLDKLAAESAVFPNGYVPTSLCRASLATLLTGLYASQHKICCNDPPDGVDRAAMHPFIKHAPTVPRLLQQAGYRSLQTGKFWEGHYANGGFTDGMTEKGRHGDAGLKIGRDTLQPIYDFIDAAGNKPFFLWYAPMMPHEPHNPPERILKKYLVEGRNAKLAHYWAMCEWFDETCGELLDHLDKKGLRENTLVVFVVDNGWIQETGGTRTTRGSFAAKSKLSPYDGGVRTPVMLRWPGHTKAGRYNDLVSTIDLAPTMLTACGMKSPKTMPGLNLLDVAAGKSKLKRNAVFGEIYLHTAVDINQPSLNLTHLWVREGDWKLITFTDESAKPELYNLANDPSEEKKSFNARAETSSTNEQSPQAMVDCQPDQMKSAIVPFTRTNQFVACFAGLLFITLSPPVLGEEGRYNIISIVTDDQARWSLGCYGNRESRTPNMDRLAREGARFLNAFVVTPVCSPSRAAFLCGRYGTQVAITDYISEAEAAAGVGLPSGTVTWPAVLQKHGYKTALIGKWHLGRKPQFHPTRFGFDHFYGALGGGFEPMNPTLEVEGKEKKLEGPASDVLTDEAMRFVQGNRDRSFALLLHFREPHLPYGPMPEQDTAPFKILDPTVPQPKGVDVAQLKQWTREYYGAIHAVDRNLGRLLAKLDELKLSEKTIVLFTSDHGYNIGHHTIHTKGNGYWIAGGVQGPKRPNMFEESIRVPLIIRWPSVVKGGMEIADTVSSIDTFATVLGMMGLPPPKEWKQEGRDFSPLLRGQKLPPRDAVFGQYDLHNDGLAYMRMIRTDQWKLVRHHHADGLDELYHLADDPGETRNLYRQTNHVATRDQLQKQLTTWQRSIDDPILRNRGE